MMRLLGLCIATNIQIYNQNIVTIATEGGFTSCTRGGGGNDDAWDRGTMLSQLAKRSIRGLVSGLSKAAVCFLIISTLALSITML